MVSTKSSLAESLGVTPKTLFRWVQRLVEKRPELFDFEEYKRCRVLTPRIFNTLSSEFGLS